MTTVVHPDREDLMAWLDAEVPPVRALEIDAHLASCRECRATVDTLKQVSAALAAWQVDAAPAVLVAPGGPARPTSVPARRWRNWRGWTWRQWAVPAGVAAAAVLIVGVNQRRAAPETPEIQVNPGRGEAQGLGSQLSQRRSGLQSNFERSAGRTMDLVVTGGADAAQPPADAPLVARTATLRVTVDQFDGLRATVDTVMREFGGSVATLTLGGDAPGRRTMVATLRVPAARLDAALDRLRALGHVREESQGTEDITTAHRDLAIRIANAKVEEQRLSELLARRAGDLKDVLEVEREQSRVRTAVEQMQAEERGMQDRVALSTVTFDAEERYRAEIGLGAMPIPARLSNALVDGLGGALDSVVTVTLAALQAGPTLLLWTAIVASIWWIVRRLRARRARV